MTKTALRPRVLRYAACVALLLPPLVGADVVVDTPRGGWRHSQGEGAAFLQRVNYPASSVNSEDHDARSLIRGHIARAAKSAPARLIVNGNAMPLSLDERGAFARPYAFGPASNGVEVRSPDGGAVRRVQFYDSYAGRAPSRLRVLLAWDSDGTDLDLHVVSPDGAHVFYGDRVARNGGALDIDVTTGYGPEIYANPTPPTGSYHVFVNYYGNGGNQEDITTAQVTIVTGDGPLREKRETVQVPLRKPGELTLVKSFHYP